MPDVWQLAMAKKRKLEAYATYGTGQSMIERSLASVLTGKP